jgi:hypothetical protein
MQQQQFPCPKCGSLSILGQQFCTVCGTKLFIGGAQQHYYGHQQVNSSPMWGVEQTILGARDTIWGDECLMWLQSFFSVRSRAAPIIQRVSLAENSSSYEERFAALSEALEKLPSILQSLKTAPKFIGVDMKKLRKIQMFEVKALDAYIKGCERSMKLLKDPSRVRYSAMTFQISLASSYWDLSKEALAEFFKKYR